MQNKTKQQTQQERKLQANVRQAKNDKTELRSMKAGKKPIKTVASTKKGSISTALSSKFFGRANAPQTVQDSIPYKEMYRDGICQKLGKSLMTMDELAVMDGGKCILQLRGVRPFLSRKYDITKHPNYKYLADHNKKHTFSIEQYLSTRLKVKSDDAYEVYNIDLPDMEEADIAPAA